MFPEHKGFYLDRLGITITPTDVQQMILECMPEAMWEITRVVTGSTPEQVKQCTVCTRVSIMHFVASDTDVEFEILNEHTDVIQLHDDPRTPPNQVTYSRRA